MAAIAAGLVIALAPTGILSVVTTVRWEQEVLRLALIVALAVAGVWPWAIEQGGTIARRLHFWVGTGVAAGVYYLVSGDALFLFAGFCLLTGGALDTWVTRAHIASEQIRRRLLRS